MIDVIGGCYREICHLPKWDRLFGSGVRAAIALGSTKTTTRLHCYLYGEWHDDIAATLSMSNVILESKPAPKAMGFKYPNSLHTPDQFGFPELPSKLQEPLLASSEAVLFFGLMEGYAKVDAEKIIYDAQNEVISFDRNKANCKSLIYILNENEILDMGIKYEIIKYKEESSKDIIEMICREICGNENAEAIIVKGRPNRISLYDRKSRYTPIPEFISQEFFRIGGGDIFAAAFTYYWAEKRKNIEESCELAAKWMASYFETRSPLFPPSLVRSIATRDQGGVHIFTPTSFSKYAGALHVQDYVRAFGVNAEVIVQVSDFVECVKQKPDFSALILLPTTMGVHDTKPIHQLIECLSGTRQKVAVLLEGEDWFWEELLPENWIRTSDIGTAIYKCTTEASQT